VKNARNTFNPISLEWDCSSKRRPPQNLELSQGRSSTRCTHARKKRMSHEKKAGTGYEQGSAVNGDVIWEPRARVIWWSGEKEPFRPSKMRGESS